MPNLDPWISQYENEDQHHTITEQEKEGNTSKFKTHLLSVRNECQRTIERNSLQHPIFLQRYQKIIEMIDWTLERYRTIIQRNKIQQQQNEQDPIIINRIREELDEKRKIAINKNKQSELRDEVAMYRLEETTIDYVLSAIHEFVMVDR
jgi:hypothetical protein